MKWIHELLKPLSVVVGIFFISTSSLFVSQEGFRWPGIDRIAETGTAMMDLEQLIYINPTSGVERELFPIIWKAFGSSMSVLGLALLFSFVVASGWTLLLWMSPSKISEAVRSITSLLSTIPDVMYVLSAQLVMVWLYMTFDWRTIAFTGAGTNEAILLPAFVLSILPSIYFLHSMLDFIDEESREDYYSLAVSKGLARSYILLRHISRNVMVKLVYQGKFIIGLIVSNLFVVEYLFNNLGMTTFLIEYGQPPVFFITAILFFIPIYIGLKLVEGFVYVTTKQEVDV